MNRSAPYSRSRIAIAANCRQSNCKVRTHATPAPANDKHSRSNRASAWLLMLVMGVVAIAGTVARAADEYPVRPVRVVVPFPPGAGTDLTARLAAEELSKRLGESFIVENKGGAGSQIGIDFVAKSHPDGYNLLWTASDGITILPAVKPSVPYKVPDDFSFIARLIVLPYVVAVNAKLPIHSMAELIAYAKANPGKLRYGSSGIGAGTHMGTELIAKAAGIQMLHVPYNGVAAALQAILTNSVDLAIASPSSIKPYVDKGMLRAIAVTGKERHPQFPAVPTLAESGLGDVNVVVWYGLMAPAGTPEPVLRRLRDAMQQIARDPKVIDRLATLGYAPSFLGGDDFRQFVVKDLEQWKEVARSAKITLE